MANSTIMQSSLTDDQHLTNNDSVVYVLNDKMVKLLIPATAYMFVLMVIGLIGNSFVCYFYTFKAKSSTNSMFIVILAIYDLLVCAITIPSEILDIQRYFTYTNTVTCKLFKIVSHCAAFASIFTLAAIAIDRYKGICHVRYRLSQARRINLVIGFISSVLSLPALATYDVVGIPIGTKENIYGFTCTLTKNVVLQSYVWLYLGTQLTLFVGLSAILIILYGIIGLKIWGHQSHLSKQKDILRKSMFRKRSASLTLTHGPIEHIVFRKDKSTERNKDLAKISEDQEGQQIRERNTLNEATVTLELVNRSGASELVAPKEETNDSIKCHTDENDCKSKSDTPLSRMPSTSINSRTNEVRFEDSTGLDIDAVRITIPMLLITVTFLLSFIPYLSLTVWRAIEVRHEWLFLSDSALVAFNIGLRSHLLNSCFNPFIYGIFNGKFRQFYFGWCCRKCN